jgi:hypothetical protein
VDSIASAFVMVSPLDLVSSAVLVSLLQLASRKAAAQIVMVIRLMKKDL